MQWIFSQCNLLLLLLSATCFITSANLHKNAVRPKNYVRTGSKTEMKMLLKLKLKLKSYRKLHKTPLPSFSCVIEYTLDIVKHVYHIVSSYTK